MAKGLDKHQERLAILNSFGKDLTRRSASSCELCSASNVKLQVFEVPPVEKEPDCDKCIFICETCKNQIERPKTLDVNHWRCLETSIWKEVSSIKIMSMILLQKIAPIEAWAATLKEDAYLEPEEEKWLNSIT
jgi:protein PhnA